jgi:hypothetical protein
VLLCLEGCFWFHSCTCSNYNGEKLFYICHKPLNTSHILTKAKKPELEGLINFIWVK